jgi:hypothetical protein
MFLLGALVTVAFISVAVILNGLRKAPEGHEDENGFHLVPERLRHPGASVLPRRAKGQQSGGRLHFPLPAGAGHFKS